MFYFGLLPVSFIPIIPDDFTGALVLGFMHNNLCISKVVLMNVGKYIKQLPANMTKIKSNHYEMIHSWATV